METRDKTNSRVGFGVIANQYGGILLKLPERAGQVTLIAMRSEQSFELRDQLGDATCRLVAGPPERVSESKPMEIAAEDFRLVDESKLIAKWRMQVFPALVRWNVVTLSGAKFAFQLYPEIVREILSLLNECIEQSWLVDLRPYRKANSFDLADILERHKATALRSRLAAFDTSRQVFRRNSQALIAQLVKGSGEMDLDLLRWDRRHAAKLALDDVVFLLFNFSASTKALVDHSRVLHKELYESEGLIPNYKGRVVSAFGSSGIVAFVEGMRNLMMHQSLIGVTHQVSMSSRTGFAGAYHLYRDWLLGFSGWSARAKNWLEEQSDRLNLVEVVCKYTEMVEEFQEWYAAEREVAHAKVYREAEMIRRAANARFGEENTPALEKLLSTSKVSFKRVREEFGRFLTAEQELLLTEQVSSSEWLSSALEFMKERYYISPLLRDLCTRYNMGQQ